MSLNGSPVTAGTVAIARWFRWLSTATAVLILLQAIMAGQFLFRASKFPHLRQDHGMLGNLIFLVVIAQLVLAFAGMRRQLWGTNIVVINVVILLLIFVQIGLGYGGRTNLFSASLHVPNGVLLFGIAVLNAVIATLPARGRR